MVLSAVFITDLKGKVIISRNYRGDIPMSASAKFTHYVQERDDSEQRPVFTEDGYTFVYLKVRRKQAIVGWWRMCVWSC